MRYPVTQKRQRASHACDFCHGRGLRCRPATSSNSELSQSRFTCLTCVDYGVQCSTDRPMRKRGRKSKANGPEAIVTSPGWTEKNVRQHWQEGDEDQDEADVGDEAIQSFPVIRRLIRIYCDTMYQCYFPFLPEKDPTTRWEGGIPETNQISYLLLMALCAVSAHSAALRGVFDQSLLDNFPIPDSDQFFWECSSRVPARLTQLQDLDYLRVFGLLTVYALQRRNRDDLHHYLGLYHACVAQSGFHDESRWPSDISLSDIDDRRRLFWCVYRLEIHSACVFGHMVRMPESQVSVLYPRITPAMDSETRAWTAGWDYITDLFRLLEYAILSLRATRGYKAILNSCSHLPSPMTLWDSLNRVKAKKDNAIFDSIDFTDDDCSNRCRYMAVQICCIEALVDIMTLLCCQTPAGEVMEIAESFLQKLSDAPLIMFQIASSQIVHQLLGVGHMLRNAAKYDNDQYRGEANRLIAFLGELVSNLEDVIPTAAAAGAQLLSLAQSTS